MVSHPKPVRIRQSGWTGNRGVIVLTMNGNVTSVPDNENIWLSSQLNGQNIIL